MSDLRSVSTRGDRHQNYDSATRARSDSVGYQGRSGPDSLAGSMAPLSNGLAPVWSLHCTPIFVVLGVTDGDTGTPSNTPGILGRRALPSGRRAPRSGPCSPWTGHSLERGLLFTDRITVVKISTA